MSLSTYAERTFREAGIIDTPFSDEPEIEVDMDWDEVEIAECDH